MSLIAEVPTTGPGVVESATVAVIGTGAIGQDLVSRIHRSPALDCRLVVGRNPDSAGLRHAECLGFPVSAAGSRPCWPPSARSTWYSTPPARRPTVTTGGCWSRSARW